MFIANFLRCQKFETIILVLLRHKTVFTVVAWGAYFVRYWNLAEGEKKQNQRLCITQPAQEDKTKNVFCFQIFLKWQKIRPFSLGNLRMIAAATDYYAEDQRGNAYWIKILNEWILITFKSTQKGLSYSFIFKCKLQIILYQWFNYQIEIGI